MPTPLMQVMLRQKKKKVECEAMPDTGTSRTIISERIIKGANMTFDTTRTTSIRCAAVSSSLTNTGSIILNLTFEGNTIEIDALVVSDMVEDALISCLDLIRLGVLPEDFPSTTFELPTAFNTKEATEAESEDDELDLDTLIEEYSDVFDESKISPVAGDPMVIDVNREGPNYKPVRITTARKIPLHFQEEAEKTLQLYIDSGVIERVPDNETTEWCSAGFFVPKPDGRVRLVVDFREINKHLRRPVHPFPSPRDILKGIRPKSKWFMKLDAFWGYYQVPIAEESRNLTTFLLPSGRYRYARLPMGLSPSSDGFCSRTDHFLRPVPDLLKIVDDALLQAPTKQELLRNFKITLQCCRRHNLTLARRKVKMGQEISFAGYIISDGGVKPDPKRVVALTQFKRPKDVTEVRSFLGLVNQLGFFIADLAHITNPLRTLLRKGVAFQWLEDQEQAFQKAKQVLTSDLLVKPYDPSLKTELLTDAARLGGLGYALVQRHEDGTLRLIQCGSRSLSPAETRYATNELEALAICHAIKDCHFYLFGSDFTVVTDHKPLLGTFNKPLLDIENHRLQRLREKVLGYSFDIVWSPGKVHYIADALSRAPHFEPEQMESVFCNAVLAVSIRDDPALQEIYDAALEDKNYQLIIAAFTSDKQPSMLPPDHPARVLKSVWDDISVLDEVLLVYQDKRIFVPVNYRKTLLQKLHSSHSGISKTKALARQFFFWPGFTKDIEEMIANCEACRLYKPSQHENTQAYQEATYPFQAVSVDLAETGGADYLVMVDRYSNYIWVHKLNKTTTLAVLRALLAWFREFGFPATIVSDNGPQFRTEFNDWCRDNHISHVPSSPRNPQSNGLAESGVKTAKLLLKKSSNEEDFRERLQAWRNVPSAGTTMSPSEKFFGRIQRHGLPVLGQPPLPTSPVATFTKLKPLPIGATVDIQNATTREWDDQGTVLAIRLSGLSYEVQRNNGKTIIRNRRFLRACNIPGRPESPPNSNESSPVALRRSSRSKQPPVRFQ